MAQAALEMNNIKLEDKFLLQVAISDPSLKKKRSLT
jgi:hypothetical protein